MRDFTYFNVDCKFSQKFDREKRRENMAKITFSQFGYCGIIKNFWPEYSPLMIIDGHDAY